MIRLFAGIELPPALQQRLDFMQGGLVEARWTRRGNFHLTLVFIGAVAEPVAGDIDAALAEIQAPAFDLTPHGVGQFDRGGHTRVVWAGVEPSPALLHLQEKVETALDGIGASFERRKYTPHITLARLPQRSDQGRVFDYLAAHALFAAPAFRVEQFTLFESVSTGEGPVYRPLVRYGLE